MSYEVLCCICGKCCGPASDWIDENGQAAHILHDAYECEECSARLDAEEAAESLAVRTPTEKEQGK